ncbi:oligopeptide transporter, OPT family [Gordonia sp. ABSL1-1]|uniref:OPT family oligopeptide transporter n=1 Tax=Gordonia sp. ABSL1-1 TaxID=3053923 RepID=UPI0025738B0B|nr:oligopeptide transporter, OPT family [Gordonia sp. ABSL1-1]MDL9935250.1 oligopeptide transporter, OPT family [Gordonia sp. ABSL1-1]
MTNTGTEQIPAHGASGLRELTLRGIILGGLITLVFTAANVYLGLRVGLTFATAIPAAVISMAILRYFADHSVVENNIVQTIASAAGTLSAIVFILPGLVIVGWWSGFPYWVTVAVCAIGGILGVMYSIPLRRALVTGSDLPYPEGVAAAEVLKVGDEEGGVEENRAGLRVIVLGSVAAAVFSLVTKLKVISDTVSVTVKIGTGGTILSGGLLMSLIGIGHLVGVAVGVAMLVGVVISFLILLPIKTHGDFTGGFAIGDVIDDVFVHEVRLVGAGAIAIAAVWTLIKIIMPILRGIKAALASTRARRQGITVDLTEQDLPFTIVGTTIVALLIPIGLLLWDFVHGTALGGSAGGIIAVSVVLIFVIGLAVAAVCGYMAGLIGSSNSPISGVGILVVLIAAILIKVVYGTTDSEAQTTALIAFTLFTGAIVFGVATISNDNLQDLKTGQLVGATPWKQQVALIIGVLFGSIIIPPILSLMNNVFGFQGAPDADSDALAAPQASLLSFLTQGVLGGDLNWSLVGLGALIGAAVIAIDEFLGRGTRFRLPPLAVGMGMYLPMSVTLVIPVGAFLGFYYNRWAERSGGAVEHKKRMGTLLATGLIVGEALFGVVFAGIVAATGDDSVLAVVGDGFDKWAQILGIIAFAATVAWLYGRTRRIAEASGTKSPAGRS